MRDSATGACIDPPPGTAAPGKGSGDPNQCATNRGAGGAWGNPFNVESGNKFERVVDIPATGGVMPLEFVRYYNSELSYWTHSYSRSLLQASGTKLVLTEDDGRARPFWLQPDGTYLSNPDARSDRIETILSGSTVVGWRRSTGDHIEEYTRYVQSGDASGQVRGRLANVTNRAGMQTQLMYPSISTGFPTQVQQRIGAVVARHLDIAWTGSGIHQRPTSVKGSWNTSSTPDVTFEYNTPHSPAPHFTPGRIVYRDGDGSSSNDPVLLYTYLWFGDRPRLTNVRTALGPANATPQSIASWTYDAAGRATGSYHGANLDSHSATYNQDGTVTVTNPLGRSFTVALGVQHGTSKVTAVEGDDVNVNGFFCGTDVRSVTYDSNGYIDLQTNRRGFVTDFDYDAEGRLVRRVEGLAQGGGSTPSTRSLDITWHPQFRSRTIEDEATQRRTYTYDALGLLERAETLDKVANVTRATEYGYSSIATAKVLTSVDGPRADVSDITQYTYANANDTAVPSKYRIGDLVSTTNALGQVTSYEYDLRGFPTVITEPSGLRTELTWDARGRLVSRRVRGAADPPGTGALTSFTYDAKNNVLLRVDYPDATSQRFEYDSALRVTAVVDGAGHRQVTDYDAAGNIVRTEKREQVGAVSTLRSAVDRVYDAMDRLRRISGAGGRTLARYDYDAEGNLTLEQDGESHSILHEYDALDRLARSIYPSATGTPDTRLAYDTLDEVTLASDLNANSTGHEVDGFGQVTRIQSPDSGVTTMQYDLAGNLTRRDHADGTWDLFTYDALNRRTFAGIRATTANPQGTTRFRYVYDETSSYGVPNLGIGRLTQVYAEPGTPPWVGRWSIYHYDARGNIVRVRTQVQAGTGLRDISYAYDLADKLTQVTYSNGRIVDYAFDALGRVSGVSTRANAAAAPVMLASQIDWLPFGPMRSLTLGNGIVTTWTWDADERLTRILSGSVLDLQYGYSLRDDIVSDGTRTYAYTADALARLTSDTPLPGGPTTQWTYDANGNRLTQVQGTRSETYLHGAHDNKLHQVDILDNGTADTRILGRDARGALTLDTHLFSSLGWSGVDMGYTRFGDLANPPAYEALEVTEQKNHDAQRIRDSRWVTWDMENDGRYLTTQDQLYDLDGQLLEQHEVLPSSLLRQFVYLDGQPLAMITGYGAIHYFHNDHLGTPQVLTNGSGAVTWKARYDAFGNATLLVNAVEQPLRFPGQVVDRHVPELHYNWHRYYDTTTGRYVSSDPIGLAGGWNTFAYAYSNPLLFIDPDGQTPVHGAAAVGYGAYRGYQAYRAYRAARAAASVASQAARRAATTASNSDTATQSCPENADEQQRCAAVLRGCRNGCIDEWAENSRAFERKWGGSNGHEAIKNCVAACMAGHGCHYGR